MNCGEFIYLCVFLMSGGQVEETNWCSIGSDHCGGREVRMKVKPLIYWSIFVPTLKLASSKGSHFSRYGEELGHLVGAQSRAAASAQKAN